MSARASTRRNDDHIIQPKHGPIAVRRFTTFDFETTDWVNAYAAVHYDGRKFTRFEGDDVAEKILVHMLDPKFAGMHQYAHNGGNFDFLFLLEPISRLLRPRGWTWNVVLVGSSILKLEARDPKRPDLVWTLIDSAKVLTMRLDQVGESMGVGNKVRTSLDYTELARPENRRLMWKYCEQDCRILYDGLIRFQDMVNEIGGELGDTAAQTSMDTWRRAFLRSQVHHNRHFSGCKEYNLPPATTVEVRTTYDTTTAGPLTFESGDRIRIWRKGKKIKRIAVVAHGEEVCEGCGHGFFRKFLGGGRTEILTMKGEGLRYYDINSHYPHCMLEPMPTGEAIYIKGGKPADVWANARTAIGFVHCAVELPDDLYIGPLPVHADGEHAQVDEGGKLTFPIGSTPHKHGDRIGCRCLIGHWTTAELEFAREVGAEIIEVYESAWCQREAIFAEYVLKMHDMKRTAKDGRKQVAKLAMNSLFGKFAIREEREGIEWGRDPSNTRPRTLLHEYADAYLMGTRIQPGYQAPQISAYVTSIARARLARTLTALANKGATVHYCDTDSVITDGELPEGKELGQWKLEHRIARATFTLPKVYLLECEGEAIAREAFKRGGINAVMALPDKDPRMCPCFGEWKEEQHRELKAARRDNPRAQLADVCEEPWRGYHVKAKGFSPGLADEGMDRDTFFKIVNMGLPPDMRETRRKSMAKVKTMFAHLEKTGKVPRPMVITNVKALQSAYDKRRVLQDGVTTLPVVVQHDPVRLFNARSGDFRGAKPPRADRRATRRASN